MTDETTSAQLSERELQVLQMVATGASNQQIARHMVISVNTVKVHLRNVFEKTGVQSRTEATLRAIQEGWVVVSDNTAAIPPPQRTYLIANQQPALAPWQQIYFVAALVLALVVMTTPLAAKHDTVPIYLPPPRFKEATSQLYYQPPTPTPILAQNAKSWIFQAPITDERAGLTVVTFEKHIFAIGGTKSTNQASRMVEIYDPATNTWSEGANKPTAATDISGVALNNKIYIPGGCTNEGRRALAMLEIYTPKTDQWTQGAALPQARCGYGLVVLLDKVYLLGGWDGQSYQDTIFVYSTTTNKWDILKSRLPESKGYMGAAVVDRLIYVVGGYDGVQEFDQTDVFNPDTGQWFKKAPLQEKRGGLGLVNVAGQLYAVGGGWTRPVTVSEKYDPANNTWSTFEAPFATQWRNAGLALVDTKIYAIGGWNVTENKYINAVVSYQVLYQIFLPAQILGN